MVIQQFPSVSGHRCMNVCNHNSIKIRGEYGTLVNHELLCKLELITLKICEKSNFLASSVVNSRTSAATIVWAQTKGGRKVSFVLIVFNIIISTHINFLKGKIFFAMKKEKNWILAFWMLLYCNCIVLFLITMNKKTFVWQ